MLSESAFLDGSIAIRVDSGQATTHLKAEATSRLARVSASVPGLYADTLDIPL